MNLMKMLRPAVWLVAAAVILCNTGAALAQGAPPVRIGAPTFLTGHSASYGTQGARGIKLAVDQVNANGGVLGRPLFVDLQDTASDSAQAVSLLRRFAASSDVVAAIGPTGTPDLLAILPVAPQLTLPVMSYASQKTLTRDQVPDRVFRMSLVETPEVLRDFVSKVATARGIHRMGVFVDRANDSSPAEMPTRKCLRPSLATCTR